MRKPAIRHAMLHALGLLILAVGCLALGAFYYLGHRWSGRRHFAPIAQTRELIDATFQPKQLFPGKSRLNILCLGLDRDWTDQDLPSSKQSRTDTIIVASLDLRSRRVTALSIPRDTRVPIRRHGVGKINDAYPRGGIDCTVATVQRFLRVPIDYYVLVKLGAVQRLVDAIGGVTIDVEKPMDYDDNWGQLHVHLRPGLQRLSGAQAEAYMRFRHDRESDFGRMRRQQQSVKAMLAALQSPAVALRVPQLIDAFSRSVETNLTREQMLALARMFHQVRPEAIASDTVPGRNVMLDGIAYVQPDMARQRLLVDWLLQGDEAAGNRLTRVRVVDGCRDPAATEQVVRELKAQQFRVAYAGRAIELSSFTQVDAAAPQAERARRVQAALRGGKLHWDTGKEDRAVTVIVGRDRLAPTGRLRIERRRQNARRFSG